MYFTDIKEYLLDPLNYLDNFTSFAALFYIITEIY